VVYLDESPGVLETSMDLSVGPVKGEVTKTWLFLLQWLVIS